MKDSLRFPILAAVALVAGIGAAYFSSSTVEAAAGNPPKDLSAFYDQSFPDASGKEFSFKDYRGKIVVVNFWATWCVPCVEEIPELSRLQTEYKKKNVEFVGIGIDNAANIAEFQKKVAASYPLLVAGAHGSELVQSYGDNMGALPYTLVLDEKGGVRGSKLGAIDVKELRGWLKSATGS
jgi:thiol-disulfide isomerase/thioredoxin